jgi:hypothetical protein
MKQTLFYQIYRSTVLYQICRFPFAQVTSRGEEVDSPSGHPRQAARPLGGSSSTHTKQAVASLSDMASSVGGACCFFGETCSPRFLTPVENLISQGGAISFSLNLDEQKSYHYENKTIEMCNMG